MWGRQRRLWWTKGETLLTTPHWPSTARLWRESAALNSWGCTSQRISPGPPTPCHSPRRHNSAYTFFASWKEQVSLHPSSPHSTGAPLRVCWRAASLTGTGTAVLLTARPSSGQWTQLQRSSVPLSPPSWTFSLHDAPAKPTASWRTPPIPPTVSSSSYHQEDCTGASEPTLPDCSTAFFPQAVRALNSNHPDPPLKPHANPYLLKHGRQRVWRYVCERFADVNVVDRVAHGGGGVMVWAGICYGQRTQVHFIDGILNSQRYRDEILRPIVVPFIHDHHLMLQHDNARPHVARICTQFLEAENIPVLASIRTGHITHWACLGCSGSAYTTACSSSCQSSNFAQPLKRSGPTFHRPQSTTWLTLCEGDVLHCVRQMVVTPDTDWFSDPPQYSKTTHFRVAFYCGKPKAHLCNNHAV